MGMLVGRNRVLLAIVLLVVAYFVAHRSLGVVQTSTFLAGVLTGAALLLLLSTSRGRRW